MKNKLTLLIIIAEFYMPGAFSAFTVNKVTGFDGKVTNINCGSNDYCYISVLNLELEDSKFHKTNSEKKILSTDTLKPIHSVIFTNEDTAYVLERSQLGSRDTKGKLFQYGLYMKKNNWKSFSIIHRWVTDESKEKEREKRFEMHLNRYNYLFVATGFGPVVFKPDRDIAIALYLDSEISKLSSFESDMRGHVYFTGKVQDKYDSVFRVTVEGDVKIPQARRIPITASDEEKTEITSIGMSNNGGVFVATTSGDADFPTGNIMKIKGKEIYTVHGQYNASFYFVCTTSDRLYFVTDKFSINFIDGEDQLTAVKPSIEGLSIEKNKCVEDSEGNVFFPSVKSILKIEKGEEVVTEIAIPSKTKNILWILSDQYDNLWVLGERLYFIEKGSTLVETVDNLKIDDDLAVMDENKRQMEILVGTKQGLFSVSKTKPETES